MHSTDKRPPHSERCSGLPRMWWPLWPLQWLRVVLVPVPVLLVPVLLLAAE